MNEIKVQKMINKLVILICVFLSGIIYAKETISEKHLFSIERQGIKLHKKGNYKKAFPKLYKTAMWGLKDSQYFLGIMYLKGQYVNQDIIKGMGFLGVANEASIKEREELFNNIYNELSDKIKRQVDASIKEFISKIGLDVKGLKCTKTSDVGSRVKVVNCHYYKANVGGSFSLD